MCFLKHKKTHFNNTKSNFEENLSDQSECEFLKYQIRNFTPFSLDSQTNGKLHSDLETWSMNIELEILKYKNTNEEN